MKTLYIECKMGIAGDMLTAALYELLDDKQRQEFLARMNALFGQDIRLSAETKTACGITGTHMHVQALGQEEAADHHTHGHHTPVHPDTAHTHHDGRHAHYSYNDIQKRLQSLPVAPKVRAHASAVYRLIGEAEAKVHHTDLTQIHFHEVGSVDALADVVAVSLLMHMLSPDQVIASPIHVGNGSVHCAHGILPVPAPATAELLRGIPFYTGDIDCELCTPTGAALARHFADRYGSVPAMRVDKIGVGHGTKELPLLNAVRAFFGETFEENDTQKDQIADISCNLDDMTGEALGLCMEILLDAGALDVYYVPIQMKKNRPGILLHCLCRPGDLERFCGLILRHTTTRGVRYQYFDRRTLSSHFETKELSCGQIRRKISENGSIRKAKYEFDDLKRIAYEQGLSVYELLETLDPVR